jgi:hypothetical protein
MLTRSIILVLLLLASCKAGQDVLEKSDSVDSSQGTQQSGDPAIDCTIRTSHPIWRRDTDEATVSVEARVHGTNEVTLSSFLLLVAVSKSPGPLQEEYWAPFDIKTGSSTKARQRVLQTDKTHPLSVRLAPSQLLWAATKSSVWPSNTLAETVPRGRYILRVEIELEGGKTVSSNEVEISITDATEIGGQPSTLKDNAVNPSERSVPKE